MNIRGEDLIMRKKMMAAAALLAMGRSGHAVAFCGF
jgi:hypothetical protein